MKDEELNNLYEAIKRSLIPLGEQCTKLLEDHDESIRQRLKNELFSPPISSTIQELVKPNAFDSSVYNELINSESDKVQDMFNQCSKMGDTLGIHRKDLDSFNQKITSMQELAQKMSGQILPINDIQSEWLTGLYDKQSSLIGELNSIVSDSSLQAALLGESYSGVQSLVNSLYYPFDKEGLYQLFDIHQDLTDQEIRDLKQAINIISQHGWFVDWEQIKDFSVLEIAVKLSKKETQNEGRKMLFQHFENKAEDIFKNAKSIDKSREGIISSIQNAYKDNNHALSVPAILAQSDGIFFYTFKKSFFSFRHNSKNTLKNDIKQKSANDNYLNVFIELVINKSAVEYSSQARKNNKYNGFYRHAIMHGECTKYPTKENCLKSLSILSYMCSLYAQWDNFKNIEQ